jgi:hypothetical protein
LLYNSLCEVCLTGAGHPERLIYTGRVASYQAKSEDEMQAVADALSLLA